MEQCAHTKCDCTAYCVLAYPGPCSFLVNLALRVNNWPIRSFLRDQAPREGIRPFWKAHFFIFTSTRLLLLNCFTKDGAFSAPEILVLIWDARSLQSSFRPFLPILVSRRA